jgi:hypothetical protein
MIQRVRWVPGAPGCVDRTTGNVHALDSYIRVSFQGRPATRRHLLDKKLTVLPSEQRGNARARPHG